MRWSTIRSSLGSVIQSGIQKGSPVDSPLRANGLTLEGVVVAVYPYDGDGPSQTGLTVTQNTVYVDVLCYGKNEGVIPRVLWTYERQGMHEGEISLPRAATVAVNEALDMLQTNPAKMDGDHVIVGFREDALNKPFVVRCIPHPSADAGNENREIGHRMRIKAADGAPRFWKHHGVFWGVSDAGDFLVDGRRAHKGGTEADGSEPVPVLDGTTGNMVLRLPEGAKLTIEITKGAQEGMPADDLTQSTTLVLEGDKLTLTNTGGAGLVVQNKDGQAVLTLGDGAMHVAVAEPLQALYNALKAKLDAFDSHTHPAAAMTAGPTPVTGMTGPPSPTIGSPGWDAAIVSDKMALPAT